MPMRNSPVINIWIKIAHAKHKSLSKRHSCLYIWNQTNKVLVYRVYAVRPYREYVIKPGWLYSTFYVYTLARNLYVNIYFVYSSCFNPQGYN